MVNRCDEKGITGNIEYQPVSSGGTVSGLSGHSFCRTADTGERKLNGATASA